MLRRIAYPTTAILLGGALLSGCAPALGSALPATSATSSTVAAGSGTPAQPAPTSTAAASGLSDPAISISLQGTTAVAATSDVRVSGSTVTILAAGTYQLAGELEGSVVIDAPADAPVTLLLDGVEIATDEGAAIAVLSAQAVTISVAADTVNTLSDRSTYAADADVTAAIFSHAPLTITGEGALVVRGTAGDPTPKNGSNR